MGTSSKAEARALTNEELALINQTRHPSLQDLSDRELANLVAQLRERRDRAQTLAHQQRRELRRKSEPKGATPAAGDRGNRLKAQILAAAVTRANDETKRRQRMAAQIALRASARKALGLKMESQKTEGDYNTRHAHNGMRAIANRTRENLIRPMERGRQRKAGAIAQARRDSRQPGA